MGGEGETVAEGDVVLFKGSNAAGVGRLLAAITDQCEKGSVA